MDIEIILRIFFIVFVTMLNFIIHEIGHLMSGLCVGYKFKSLGLLYFMWYKDEIKQKITFSRINPKLYNYTAFCDMDKSLYANRVFFRIFYTLGGGLANLFIAAIFTISSIYFTQIDFTMYILVSLMVAIYSLVPMSIGGSENDGMHILMLLKSKDARRGAFAYDYVQQELSKGVRYRDLDAEMFTLSEPHKANKLYNSMLVMFNSKRLYDLGKYDLSFECLNQLDVRKLSFYIKNMVNLDLLYYFTIYKYDIDMAKNIYANKQIVIYLASTAETQVNSMRILSAYSYFIEGNKDKGKFYLEKAFKLLKSTSSTTDGLEIMEKDYCLQLNEIYIKVEESL